MHIELMKCRLFLSLKRKILRLNIMKDIIAMKQFKALDKNYFTSFKNLVVFFLISDIRNVLIAVLVEQFNPLLPFEAINYRAIVENSRILLDELYKRVIQFQDQHVHGPNDLLLSSEKILKTKKVEIGSELPLPNQKNELPKDRPNYVYGNKNASKPSFSEKKVIRSSNRGLEQEMRFLWDRCQSMKEQF